MVVSNQALPGCGLLPASWRVFLRLMALAAFGRV
nr:MAG TPA: hypothetical protein [Crassvirales sp.]